MNDMNELDNYVRAVTRRLELDPTVHYQVAREVREHLEDAAEEARERGCSDEDSVRAALKAFGDADDLAEQLWQANRQRMRLRALAIWAGRLVLVPLAVVAAVGIGFTTVRSFATALGWLSSLDGFHVPSWAPRFAAEGPVPKPGLSEEQLRLFRLLDEKLEHARALVKERPGDPLLHAHYVRLLSEQALGKKATEQQRQEWTEALARGKQLEPDNAIYNYLEAAFLMERGTEAQKDAGLPYEVLPPEHAVGIADQGKQTKQNRGVRLTVKDPQALDAALAQVRDGLRKPHCTLHVGEVMALRASLRRTPRTLADELRNIAENAAVLIPHTSPLRSLAERLPGAAVWLAEQGRHEEAVWLAGVMARPGAQVAADANSLIELLVGHAMATVAEAQAPALYKSLGMPERAASARAEYERDELAWRAARHPGGDQDLGQLLMQRAGVLLCMLVPAGTTPEGLRPMLGPYRTLEHIELERLALALTLVPLVLVALVLAASAGWALLRYRSPDRSPKLLFIGWRRLAGVILLGVLVPAVAYWAWTRWAPWNSLQYGINYVLARRMIEMSAAVAAIFCAVLALSLRSAAKRCIEAGIEGVPTGVFNPLRRPVGVLASTCAALVIGAFVALAAEAGGADRRDSIIAALGSAALVVSVLFMAWQVRHASGTYRPAREWLGRAAVPMAVAVGVAAALSAAPAWTRFLWGEPMALALILTVGAAAILTTVALVERAATRPPDEQRGHACRAVVRSALPVLAACIAVLSLAAGMWLNRVDARYARAAEKTSLMRSEIDMTAFARYQKEVQEAVRQWTPPPPHP